MSAMTITIPDEHDARVVNGYCVHYAYPAMVTNPAHDPEGSTPDEDPMIPNPQSKTAFVRAGLVKHLRDAVRAAENSAAVLAARAAVQDVEGLE